MAHNISYDRPREKLQHKGVSALSDSELLQLIIGSGNGTAGVAWIARETLKQLKKYGYMVTFDHLVSVKGLGPARASLIIAAIELVNRYPAARRATRVENRTDARLLVKALGTSTQYQLIYLTLDGGMRLIAQRTVFLHDDTAHIRVQRVILANAVSDQAAGIYIAMGHHDHSLEPSSFELRLMRDIYSLSSVLLLRIHGCVLVNSSHEYPLLKESW
ncbi:hypothetical protein H7200_01900 [Candidatus Saccharibacteria bacterium]|nr:hypothetical protein [Candidatus Saccharibacteria bacterium]